MPLCASVHVVQFLSFLLFIYRSLFISNTISECLLHIKMPIVWFDISGVFQWKYFFTVTFFTVIAISIIEGKHHKYATANLILPSL